MTYDTKSKITNHPSLPTIPVVISRLVGVLKDENASMNELVEIIRHDQSITSRIVSIANSPFFGYPGRINSIEQAVLMLGFNLVKSISLSVSVFTIFPVPYVMLKKLWAHSFKVATLSGLLCMKITSNNNGISFLAGLLHDIGRVLFLSLNKSDYSPLYQLKEHKLFEVEKSLFYCHHPEAARWFLEELFFPQEIILPIYYHHNLEGLSLLEPLSKDIILGLYLAEGLIEEFDSDTINDGHFTEAHSMFLKQAGVTEKDLRRIKEDFFLSSMSADNFFEI